MYNYKNIKINNTGNYKGYFIYKSASDMYIITQISVIKRVFME
jgi:hypothetical protein